MKLIVANWKMNPLRFSLAKTIFLQLKKKIKKRKDVKVIICPPYLYLQKLSETQGKNSPIELGVQNCFWEKGGAFTGEISPLMIKNLKVKYVILGHSERRKYLKEDDQIISKKVISALEAKLRPILCIGETREEREKEKFTKVIKSQLEAVLTNSYFQVSQNFDLILAYEPIWAIGTGNFCPPDMAREMLIFIKRVLSKYLTQKWKKTKILYGGSVDSKNAKYYIDAGFDGLLVGGSSLKISEFTKMIKNL